MAVGAFMAAERDGPRILRADRTRKCVLGGQTPRVRRRLDAVVQEKMVGHTIGGGGPIRIAKPAGEGYAYSEVLAALKVTLPNDADKGVRATTLGDTLAPGARLP